MSALLFFAEWPKNDGPGQPLAVKIGPLPARGQYQADIWIYEFEQCEFRNLEKGL
jgi:hypothetical protein